MQDYKKSTLGWIQKMEKYLSVVISPNSNQYLYLSDVLKQDCNNVYWMMLEKFKTKLVKNGQLWVIKPSNWDENDQPIFVPDWACISQFSNYYLPPFIIFKSNNEKLKQLVKNHDDVFLVSDLLKQDRYQRGIPLKIKDDQSAKVNWI